MSAIRFFQILILLFCTTQAEAQFRKYSNEFLNIGAGARGMAMGGANIASVADGTAGYWNPAGLVNVNEGTQVNLMHSEYFAGIGQYDFANVAIPTTSSKRAIGVTALRFAVDDIMNTLFLVEPDGSLNYNNISPFSSADYAFLLSYAQQLSKSENKLVNFGLNAKVIHRSVGSFAKAWGFGLDAGLQIFKNKWRIGIVGKDISTTFNTWSFSFTDKEKEQLYLTQNDIPVKSTEMTSPRLQLGLGRVFNLGKGSSILAETNFDVTFDGQRNTVISGNPVSVDPKVGLEYGYKNIFFVRGGIGNFQQGLADGDTLNQKRVWIYQPSAGAGFRVGPVVIDYAFANLANQSNPLYTHVISLKSNLGWKNSRKK
ncbi:MAG: PorV/PorQ family protein [Niabella sp.]